MILYIVKLHHIIETNQGAARDLAQRILQIILSSPFNDFWWFNYMQTLYVELGERRYPIFIGSHLDPEKLLKPYLHGRQVMLVSNTTVHPSIYAALCGCIECSG